ncbi:glycosyltransferase [Flavobacterium sp.]|uniref:glycosyltransferase n=1 Tax=Flavobacterium sp. TaxID=239 RepID=UPI003263AB91
MIRERGLENSVLCRDLDGFFRHVWSVHPFASMLTSDDWTARYGTPEKHELNERHTFIEGKVGRFRWLSPLFPLNFLLSQILLLVDLARLIRRENIRVIRVGDPLYLGLLGLALARIASIPMVIRVNGNNDKVRETTGRPIFPRLFRSTAVEKRVEHFVFPRADLVAAPNQDNVDYSVASGAHPDRVAIFPYGNLLADEHLREPQTRMCDADFFSKLGVRPSKYLLSVGRLEALKHPDDLMRVLASVRSAGHDLDLVYAGDGSMRVELIAQAHRLGLVDHVRFVGNQNQYGLAQLNTFATTVLSALTGRALSEAALCAAPIVAYDVDWQGDLIQTGKTGELVPFGAPDAMADAVLKFLRDPKYARAMGRGARQLALHMLDPERLNENERNTYSELLARRR